jgi:hypothetical protein
MTNTFGKAQSSLTATYCSNNYYYNAQQQHELVTTKEWQNVMHSSTTRLTKHPSAQFKPSPVKLPTSQPAGIIHQTLFLVCTLASTTPTQLFHQRLTKYRHAYNRLQSTQFVTAWRIPRSGISMHFCINHSIGFTINS